MGIYTKLKMKKKGLYACSGLKVKWLVRAHNRNVLVAEKIRLFESRHYSKARRGKL